LRRCKKTFATFTKNFNKCVCHFFSV